jgi:hypothetical protein
LQNIWSLEKLFLMLQCEVSKKKWTFTFHQIVLFESGIYEYFSYQIVEWLKCLKWSDLFVWNKEKLCFISILTLTKILKTSSSTNVGRSLMMDLSLLIQRLFCFLSPLFIFVFEGFILFCVETNFIWDSNRKLQKQNGHLL